MENTSIDKNTMTVSLIMDKAMEKGRMRRDSGQLSFNGRNYADDIISAVQYVSGLDIYDKNKSVSEIIKLIESHIDDYINIYTDSEGFGHGTIVGIIDQIKELK